MNTTLQKTIRPVALTASEYSDIVPMPSNTRCLVLVDWKAGRLSIGFPEFEHKWWTSIGSFDKAIQDLDYSITVHREHREMDPLDVPSRLAELREMNDGWLGDGAGVAPDNEHLTWLSEQFRDKYPAHLPLPRAYPTPSGNIEMEWSLGDYGVILAIDLTHRSADLLAFREDHDKDDREESSINLEDVHGWMRIAELISTLAG